MKAGRLLLSTLMLVSLFSFSAFSQTLTVTAVPGCGPASGMIIATVSGFNPNAPHITSNFDYTGPTPAINNYLGELVLADTLFNAVSGPYNVSYFYDGIDGPTALLGNATLTNNAADTTPPTQICGTAQLIGNGIDCTVPLPDFRDSTTVTDNCDPNPTRTQVPPPGTMISDFTVVTLFAEDASGNRDSCNFSIEVLDTVPPSFTCAPDTIFLTADNSCQTIVPNFTDTLVVGPDCNPISSKIQTPPAGNIVGDNTPVTITVIDAAGNADSCTFLIRLIDNKPPIVSCPGSINIIGDANCEAVLPDYRGDAIIIDNCPTNTTVIQSPAPGTTISAATIVTITVTDESGNSDDCSFIVNIEDDENPVITSCPGPQVIIGDANCEAPLPNYTTSVVVTDNCSDFADLAIIQFPLANTIVNGLVPVIIFVRDEQGNTSACSFNVQVRDTLPPVITCPSDDILITDANCEAVLPDYTGDATATDNCQPPPTVTQSPAPGTVIAGVGTVETITLTATDPSGNFASCTFTVTLEDTLPPAPLVCPANITQSIDPGECTAIVTFATPTVDDNCTVVTTVTQTAGPASGTAFPIGTTTVTFVASDTLGNSDSCSFTVTVEDTGAPAFINCPADTTIFSDAANCGATFTFATPIAADQCSGAAADSSVTVMQTSGLASGSIFPVGDSRVVFTATDSVGNVDSCVFIVTVADTIDPVAVCTDTTVYLDQFSIGTLNPAILAVGSSDNCGPLTFATIPPVLTCNNVGSTVPVTVTVFDLDSNSATCVAQITVLDTLDPTVVCQDTTIYLDASGDATVSAAALVQSANDNCSVTGFTLSQSTFSCADTGVNSVILTATDASGNTATCVTQITVVDTIAPAVVCQNTSVLLDGSGNASITASDVDGGSSDNCSFTATVNPSTFTTADIGPNNVTLVITDQNGNSDSCVAVVTVIDPNTPTIICQDTTIILNALGLGTLSPFDLIDETSDTIGVTGISIDQTLFDCSNIGSNSVVVRFIKLNGNPDSCTATVTVIDNMSPTVACQNISIQLDASGNASLVGADLDNGSTDNCGIASLTVSDSTFTCADAGANLVTLFVTDLSGNVDSCTATVTVVDNISPTVVCQNIIVQLDASGNANITAADIDNGSTDNCGNFTMTLSDSTFTCADAGTNTVTLTVTDASGNSSNCTATVTVTDTLMPIVVCQNITVQLDASGNASISPADINNGSADNCGIASTMLSQTTFSCTEIGVNTVTLVVTDVFGNVDSCIATVTVQDNINPNAVCQNLTVFLNANGDATILPADIDNGSSDNCGNMIMTLSDSTFTCADLGPNAVTLTVTDAGGNTDICPAIITVVDSTAPVVVCQDITVQLNAAGIATITPADIDNGSSDNCSAPTFSLSKTTFTCADAGTNTVTLTVTDAAGNSSSCTATVTVEDTIAPTVACQNITVQLNASGSVTITAASIDNGSTDNCSGLTRTISQSTFDCTNLGANTVTLVVTDASGNADSCMATVTVEDNTLPTAICQSITVQLDANGNANITASDIDNGSSDNCGLVSMVLSDSTFSCTDIGPNAITLTVTDAAGNTAICSAIVTVVDNLAPTAICQSITVQLDAAGNASIVAADIDNGSTDNCAIVNRTLSQSTFTCANIGVNTITLSVIDASGNSDFCIATVTVVDTITPTVVCQNITVQLNASGSATITPASIDNGSTDNCGPLTRALSQTTFSCTDLGANNVTLIVTDASGNVDSCTAVVTVEDNLLPTAICQSITVQLDANGNANITASDIDNGSSDNCSLVSMVLSDSTFSCADIGQNSVTLTVTDAAGNTANCSAIVTVEDNIAPTAICQSITVQLDAAGNASIVTSDIDNGSTDNCSAPIFSLSKTTFTCADAGINTVTLTVTDASGNSSICTATVTVEDTITPTVVCQNITVQLNASGNATITPASIDNGSTDNCGPLTRALSQTTFSCTDLGANNVTLIVTDASGNVDSCTAVVTVEDNLAPSAICQSITVQLDATGNATITAASVNNGSTDNCGTPTLTVDVTSFTCADLGTNAVTLTATDASGNTDNCTAIVTVQDNIAPTAVCQNITAQLNASGIATITAADIDNGSTDNCSIVTYTVSQTSFTCADAGANTVTFTVTDASGNSSSCTATVTVQENVAPIAVCQNLTVQLDATGNATITASAIDDGSTDNCAIVSRTLSKTSFTCADVGVNTVTLTVTDGSGNTSTCTATVTVFENVNPTAICQNITVQLGASGTVTITGADVNNGSTDNCAVVSTTLSQTIFSCADVGVNTVVMTVTDASGNTDNCTAVVTVQDLIAPSITCPANITVTAAAGACDAAVSVPLPTTADNCSVATVTNNFTNTNNASGTYPIGTTNVVYTVTDASGNTTTCSFDVIVNFNAPAILISGTTIAENSPVNTLIGALSLSPSSPGATFSFVGTGNDNARFTLQGNEIFSNEIFDFEAQSTYTIRVQSSLCGGTVARNITITVTDVNDAPASITLSNNVINENVPVGTMIGFFSTIDEDANNTHTYTIISGNTDNDLTIVGDELRVNNMLDYETKPTYTILVRSTDQGGLFVEQTFTIFVEVDPGLPLDIPTAFTPDGDGVNDTWNIDNIGVHTANIVEVYDRWGKRVFYMRGYNNMNEWNGHYDGDRVAAGTYFYIVDVNDGRDPYTGTVTLIY